MRQQRKYSLRGHFKGNGKVREKLQGMGKSSHGSQRGSGGMNNQIPKEVALMVRGRSPTQSMTVDQMQPLPAKSTPGKKDLGNKHPINSSPTSAFLWKLIIGQSSWELERKRLIDETDPMHIITFTQSRVEQHVEAWLRRCEHKSQLTHSNFYF